MNRKKIIALVVVVVILAAGYTGLNYIESFKTAYFNIKLSNTSITVYNSANKNVGALARSGKISLRQGSYRAVPSGKTVNTSAIPFTVTGSGAYVTVDPGYSKAYLQQLLAGELPDIASVITSAYPTVVSGFTLNPGALYLYGGWYATTLVQNSPGPGANGDVYRTVLRKQNGVWKMVATPAIVLSAKDYPTIPVAILTNINAQSGY